MAAKYLIATFGCKVNQYESRQLAEALEALGMEPACPGETPSLSVVNTCAVTSAAFSKGRQAVRCLSFGGRTPVVVVGCGATADADQMRKLEYVSAVLGHHCDVLKELRHLVLDRLNLVLNRSERHPIGSSTPSRPTAGPEPGDNGWMITYGANSPERIGAFAPSDNVTPNTMPPSPTLVNNPQALLGRIDRFPGHQRAFLKVQDGCDAHCSYCIIPRLRPLMRSKPIEVAVAEAAHLVQEGYKEIVVTGIFLGAYGRETAIRKRYSPKLSPLGALIRALTHVQGLQRLRLSSLEPGDFDECLLDVLASHQVCVPHLHLPLQSGSPSILKRMNRQYTIEAYMNMIDRIRTKLDRPAITTDIMVGFPGESRQDFEATLAIARYSRFCKVHAFPFSPRDKTAAIRWQKAFVRHREVRERMRLLAQTESEVSESYRRELIGVVERVLVEPGSGAAGREDSNTGVRCGRSDRYFEVHFFAPGIQPGELVPVRIDQVTPGRTHGTYLAEGSHVSTSPALTVTGP